ncbi:MAG: hypothetical protein KDB10_21145 [Acidimicrobiales bacterium]|nr:hypothetical protein [Acidimicrobiales bacterium]MCB9371665.1 peroxidase [Microthrixaceae bacterium]
MLRRTRQGAKPPLGLGPLLVAAATLTVATVSPAASASPSGPRSPVTAASPAPPPTEGAAGERRARITVPRLDGWGNNPERRGRGRAGRPYGRVAPPAYPDGQGAMVPGPSPRYVSNRIFNDRGINLFSGRGATQWVWAWGQFLDHTLGLAQPGGEAADLEFDADDPLEEFTNDFGILSFSRSAAAPGRARRQQVNALSSYLDAWNVYGGTDERLEWLREGPVNGDLSDNGPHLLLDAAGNLPRRDERGDPSAAPAMELQGRLQARPEAAVVAGDVRANENLALTAIHTLFAREHNRLVDQLPPGLSDQRRFDIARRVVMAEMQYVTYREFLPAVGVRLAPYAGYDPDVNPKLSNEFATVGFRAHSMVHGAFVADVAAGALDAAGAESLRGQGVRVTATAAGWHLSIPLHVGFANPDLLEEVGVDAVLAGLGHQLQYANDEQVDNQLRSVLFQVPGPGVTDPATQCEDQDDLSACFTGVVDLAAVDLARARDHGIPGYNDLRAAYGLPRVTSFTQITGEATDQFPVSPLIDPDDPIDDPNILDVIRVEPPGDEPVRAVHRSTVAARLRAVYGTVDAVDALVGMLSEPHLPDSEMGPLQTAIWARQFEALRAGDRYFHANRDDPGLVTIRRRFGIDHRVSLDELVARNTDLPAALPADARFLRVP